MAAGAPAIEAWDRRKTFGRVQDRKARLPLSAPGTCLMPIPAPEVYPTGAAAPTEKKSPYPQIVVILLGYSKTREGS